MENREAYANLLLPKLLAERDITGRDAALATELAYGTLRGQGTYDAVLAACSDRPLDQLDPPVRQILRLGAHQLLATRIGAHAAVATSVDLAKQVVGRGSPATSTPSCAGSRPETWTPGWRSSRPTRRPTPTAAWPSATATPAGSSPPTGTPSATRPRPSSRPPWPRATPAPRSPWPPFPAAPTATR